MSGLAGDEAEDGSDATTPGRRAPAAARDDRGVMLVDAMGLAFTAHGGRIIVHYPVHDTERGGAPGYAPGSDIGPIPESYWTDPPNEITRQRVALWRTLLERSPTAHS